MSKEIDLVVTQSTDAQEWASEFMRIFGDRKQDIDEGLMITWFANAIEVAKDKSYIIGVDLASGPDMTGYFNWDTNYEKVSSCGDVQPLDQKDVHQVT
jgi:hypothetical protein